MKAAYIAKRLTILGSLLLFSAAHCSREGIPRTTLDEITYILNASTGTFSVELGASEKGLSMPRSHVCFNGMLFTAEHISCSEQNNARVLMKTIIPRQTRYFWGGIYDRPFLLVCEPGMHLRTLRIHGDRRNLEPTQFIPLADSVRVQVSLDPDEQYEQAIPFYVGETPFKLTSSNELDLRFGTEDPSRVYVLFRSDKECILQIVKKGEPLESTLFEGVPVYKMPYYSKYMVTGFPNEGVVWDLLTIGNTEIVARTEEGWIFRNESMALTLSPDGGPSQTVPLTTVAPVAMNGSDIGRVRMQAGSFDCMSPFSFICSHVREMVISGRNNAIPDWALAWSLLEKVRFKPDADVRIIGVGAFANASIKEISIPVSVTLVGERAFFGCGLLEVVIFDPYGRGLLTIGGRAFERTAVRTISLPVRAAYMGASAFPTVEEIRLTLDSQLRYVSSAEGQFNKLRTLVGPPNIVELFPNLPDQVQILLAQDIERGPLAARVSALWREFVRRLATD
jgi:hypothetical protein